MADGSYIEWTDTTWSPITGCSVVSPGCTNCYAMRLAGGRLQHHPSRAGLTTPSKAGPLWNGQVRFNEEWLLQPLRWAKPRRIFVCAHGDLFHESVPNAWIDQVFAVMALAQHHTFQVLTKRAARMRDYLSDPAMVNRVIHEAFRIDCEGGAWMNADHQIAGDPIFPLPNVWLGVSAEDQARADERVPLLLQTPAAIRFLSAEPLLQAIDFRPWLSNRDGCEGCDDGDGYVAPRCQARDQPRNEQCPRNFAVFTYPEGPANKHGEPAWVEERRATLDWVIVGGESGPGARPMHPDWARQIRDACAEAGVAFFFKQWGTWRTVEAIDGSPLGFIYMDATGLRDHELWAKEEDAREVSGTAWWFERVGKAAAGRALDGVTHDAMPDAR